MARSYRRFLNQFFLAVVGIILFIKLLALLNTKLYTSFPIYLLFVLIVQFIFVSFIITQLVQSINFLAQLSYICTVSSIAMGVDLLLQIPLLLLSGFDYLFTSNPYWIFSLSVLATSQTIQFNVKQQKIITNYIFTVIGIVASVLAIIWGLEHLGTQIHLIDGILSIFLGIEALFLISMVYFSKNNYTFYKTNGSVNLQSRGKQTIATVVPAYNEERLIKRTLSYIPESVDHVYVVNDGSTDKTAEKVKEVQQEDPRVTLLNHQKNKGVGAAIITGYKQAYKDGYDIFVVVAGDAQMAWDDLPNFIEPIKGNLADYVKGNRFMYGDRQTKGNAWQEMPRHRFFGNILCSIITIIGSGYKGIFDSQMGYTAIHRDVIPKMEWTNMRQGYGYPGDWLCHFHPKGIRVQDVPTKAIYLKNEKQTKIKARNFLFYTSWVMLRGYLHRLKVEYLDPKMWKKRIIVPLFWLISVLGLSVGIDSYLNKTFLISTNPTTLLFGTILAGSMFIISDVLKDEHSVYT